MAVEAKRALVACTVYAAAVLALAAAVPALAGDFWPVTVAVAAVLIGLVFLAAVAGVAAVAGWAARLIVRGGPPAEGDP